LTEVVLVAETIANDIVSRYFKGGEVRLYFGAPVARFIKENTCPDRFCAPFTEVSGYMVQRYSRIGNSGDEENIKPPGIEFTGKYYFRLIFMFLLDKPHEIAAQGNIHGSYEVGKKNEDIIKDTDNAELFRRHYSFYFIGHLLYTLADFIFPLNDTKSIFHISMSSPLSKMKVCIKNTSLKVNSKCAT
jgi:hypothetical protein